VQSPDRSDKFMSVAGNPKLLDIAVKPRDDPLPRGEGLVSPSSQRAWSVVTSEIAQYVLGILDDLSRAVQQGVALCKRRVTGSTQPLRETPLVCSAQCLGIVERVANITNELLVQADGPLCIGRLLREDLVAQREHACRYSHHRAHGRQPDA
jgi:hypothetical protein